VTLANHTKIKNTIFIAGWDFDKSQKKKYIGFVAGWDFDKSLLL